MKLNKFKTIVPAAALLFSASLCSCMDDLDKGNIDPNGDANPNITGASAMLDLLWKVMMVMPISTFKTPVNPR